MRFTPRAYQSSAIDFACKNEVCALLLDMGLGKTVCTLSVITEELDNLKTPGICIIAPINVVNEVWAQEAELWNHTKHLKVVKVRGTADERAAMLKAGGKDIYLVSYSNLQWLCDWMLGNEPPFDGIVFDESSCLKDSGTKRFKAIKKFMPFMRRRMILTGTPAAESLINLWAQYYLLDQGQRLGQYITHFKQEHYNQIDRMGYKLSLRKGHDKKIYDAVKDITISLRSEDHINLAPVVYTETKLVLSEPLMDQYKTFETEMFIELGKSSIEACNAAVLSMKCRQLTSGAIYTESAFKELHTVKMDALEEIVEQMDGQPLMVGYEFKHEAERFRKRFPDAPIVGGKAKPADVSKAFKRWNAGKLPLLFVHPASVGHGLNLQFGGHHLLWFTTTWSGERYQQLVKRLSRSGQKHPVVVNHLNVKGTIDSLVLSKQKTKGKNQQSMLAALGEYRKQL